MSLPETSHINLTVKGFTLVELLLTVTLASMIAAFAFPTGISFYRAQVLHEATDGVMSALRKAQSLALTNKNDAAFGVRVLSDSYVLFEGDSYAARSEENDEVYPIAGVIEVSGVSEITFEELSGLPSISGDFTFNIDGKEEVVTVSSLGLITQ